jgi:cytochrome c-type protein NapC
MDFTTQSTRARRAHSTSLASGEATCIDCHKGIAHELPDMGEDFQAGQAHNGLASFEAYVMHLPQASP